MNCLSIAVKSVEKAVALTKGFEIVEYRLDKIEYKDSVSNLFSVEAQTVATYRPSSDVSDDQRLIVLKEAIAFGASYVDIEIESNDDYKQELVSFARDKGCKIIISYHDYDKTPQRRELEQLLRWAQETEFDIIKIACVVNDKKEAARLLSLYDSEMSLIVIGMGELGKVTRVASLLLGAPFTFVSIDKDNETAAGQLSSVEMDDILKRINA